MIRNVSLKFNSLNGNEYLYDDVTGNIFKWSDVHERILNLMHQKLDSDTILNELCAETNIAHSTLKNFIKDIEFWYKINGAFFRDDLKIEKIENNKHIIQLVENEMYQLVLSVTDNCNLACTYCAFSQNYSLTKNKSKNYMTIATAKESIDYFYSIVSKQFMLNPKKEFAFTFYGGEPLMNFDVIKFSIEYIKTLFKNKKTTFSLTTNGVLLNESIIKFLSENNVFLLISLDGTEHEHDDKRKTIDGKGTFKTILKNLKKVKEQYPNYFHTRMGITSVFDYNTDLISNDNYFQEMEDNEDLPIHLFASIVLGINTDYYKQFSDENIIKHKNDIKALEEKYIDILKNKDKCSSYLMSLLGPKYNRIAIRQRFHDIRGSLLPTTGTCMIGRKMHISYDGKIDICEKVNGKNDIGNLKSGLDFEKITTLLNNYSDEVISKCNGCNVQKICPFCFMHFETDNGFKGDLSRCRNEQLNIKKILSNYVSVLEESPDIEFDFLKDAFRVAALQLNS